MLVEQTVRGDELRDAIAQLRTVIPFDELLDEILLDELLHDEVQVDEDDHVYLEIEMWYDQEPVEMRFQSVQLSIRLLSKQVSTFLSDGN